MRGATLGVLALAAAGAATAQTGIAPKPLGTISCTASAVPLTVRAEGIAELVGDIVVTCTNLAPQVGGNFQTHLTANVSVSLAAVNATSNIDFGAGAAVSDAVLVINGNHSTSPTPTSTFSGADSRFPGPQFGTLAAANRLEWTGVQFPVPGAPNDGSGDEAAGECDHFTDAAGGCFPTQTTLRITAIRANASMLGLPPVGGGLSTQVTAFVSITRDVVPPVSNNVLNVAVPLRGLASAVNDPPTARQCDDTLETISIPLDELFATAFKIEGAANSDIGNDADEAGYFAPGSNGGDGASGPTRFLLRFRNIPAGVTIQAPRHVAQAIGAPASSELELALVEGADANGAGGTVVAGDELVDVNINSGSGFAVYEVLAANPAAIEGVAIALSISWDGGTPPPAGVGEVAVAYAPLSTTLAASRAEPEPRFIDTNDFETLLTVAACQVQPPLPVVLTKLSGDNQTVIGGKPFQPFVVGVTQGGLALGGRTLFVSVTGPGSAFVACPANVISNASGVASIACGSAVTPSDTSVVINVSDGITQLTPPFMASIQAAQTHLSLLTPKKLRLAVNETTLGAIRVKATTEAGAAAGVAVYFSATPGITVNAVDATNARGIASTPVTLACLNGDGRVDFGLAPGQVAGSVHIEPLPAGFDAVVAVQGDGQSAPSGQRLAQALVIETSDECGNPVKNLDVDWSVQPAAAARLEASHAKTNLHGRASTLVRVLSHSAPFMITASVRGKSVAFHLEAEAGPTTFRAESGKLQRVTKTEIAPRPLVARVTGPGGQGFSGIRVNFRVAEGSGQLNPASVLTAEDGRAAAVFTAGSRVGGVLVEATAIGQTAYFVLLVTGHKPLFDRSAVVDGASFGIGLTPGASASVFGVNLMEDIHGVMVPSAKSVGLRLVDDPSQAAGLWPLEFEGVSVRINGVPAPLFALACIDGSEQINFQVPFDLGTVSEATVEINNNGSTTTVDHVPILPRKPRLFEIAMGGKSYALALHADYSPVGPESPARPGEIILLYMTGLGMTDPAVPTNLPGPVPAPKTLHQPEVRLDGVSQEVLGSYYAPQLTSVYQVNLRVAEDTAPGEREIEVRQEGVAAQRLLLPVAR